jgi:predicted anti-sigma-YlaC factor YlaD
VTCTEFLEKLTDYFDGTVHEPLLAEIRTHMKKCSHCEVVVNTVEKTIHIYRSSDLYEYEMPDDLRDRLRSAIMDKCRGSKSC